MDTENPNPETNETPTETVEEREKRTRKSVPLMLYTGSNKLGWKPAGTETFEDEREAWRWVEKNGTEGVAYQPMRAYGAKRLPKRKLMDVEDDG